MANKDNKESMGCNINSSVQLHFLCCTASCPSLNINCPAMRTLLCPGDSITYTCVLNSLYYVVHMQWTRPAFQCNPAGLPRNAITFSQSHGFSNPAVITCGNFSAVMTNVSGTCYTSVLTIPTPQYYNGTTIQCKDGTDGTVSGSDTLDIQLAGNVSIKQFPEFGFCQSVVGILNLI